MVGSPIGLLVRLRSLFVCEAVLIVLLFDPTPVIRVAVGKPFEVVVDCFLRDRMENAGSKLPMVIDLADDTTEHRTKRPRGMSRLAAAQLLSVGHGVVLRRIQVRDLSDGSLRSYDLQRVFFERAHDRLCYQSRDGLSRNGITASRFYQFFGFDALSCSHAYLLCRRCVVASCFLTVFESSGLCLVNMSPRPHGRLLQECVEPVERCVSVFS